MSLINPNSKIETSGSVRRAVGRFLVEIVADPFELNDINIKRNKRIFSLSFKSCIDDLISENIIEYENNNLRASNNHLRIKKQ